MVDSVKKEQADPTFVSNESQTHSTVTDATQAVSKPDSGTEIENANDSEPIIKKEDDEADPEIKTEDDTQKPSIKTEYQEQDQESTNNGNPNNSDNTNEAKNIKSEHHRPAVYSGSMSSQYPMTSVVYIRNLSRPLAIVEFKKFIVMCAGGVQPVKVWFDSIRSHCFIKFQSALIARKVRERMNNIRFPAQETHRLAMVTDYIPEEKLDEWIQTEENEGNRSLTRWVVKYTKGENGSSAELVVDDSVFSNKGDRRDSGVRTEAGEDLRSRLGGIQPNTEKLNSRSPSPERERGRTHKTSRNRSYSPSRSRSPYRARSFDSRSRSPSRTLSRTRSPERLRNKDRERDDRLKSNKRVMFYTKVTPSKRFSEASADIVRKRVRERKVPELSEVAFKKNLNYSTHGRLMDATYEKEKSRSRNTRVHKNDDRPTPNRKIKKMGSRQRRKERDRRLRLGGSPSRNSDVTNPTANTHDKVGEDIGI